MGQVEYLIVKQLKRRKSVVLSIQTLATTIAFFCIVFYAVTYSSYNLLKTSLVVWTTL